MSLCFYKLKRDAVSVDVGPLHKARSRVRASKQQTFVAAHLPARRKRIYIEPAEPRIILFLLGFRQVNRSFFRPC